MRLISTIVLVAVLWHACSAQVQMQNVYSYLGRGFDLAKGDLRPTTFSGLSATWNKANVYEVERSADGTPTETRTDESNDFVFFTSNSPRSFADELLKDVNVTGLRPTIGFNNNSLVSSIIRQRMTSGATTFMGSAHVALLKASMRRANVTQEFLDDIGALPAVYNYDDYLTFITKYGTHYIRNAVFGGRISTFSTITIAQMGTLRASDIDIANGLRIMARFRFSLADDTAIPDYTTLEANSIALNIYQIGGTSNLDYGIWKESLAQNPMPISVDLDPYVFLIENSTIQANMILALQSYLNSSLGFDNSLDAVAPTTFVPAWDSDQSFPDTDVYCRNYDEFGAYRRTGDVCNDFSSLLFVAELAADSTLPRYTGHVPLLTNPNLFDLIWTDSGSGAALDGSFWAPRCPLNYYAVGNLNVLGYSSPPTTQMTCIHARCVEVCTGQYLWADYGSDANMDLTLYSALNSTSALSVGSFIGFGTYDLIPTDFLRIMCLRRACVTAPDAYSAALETAMASVWATEPAIVLAAEHVVEVPINPPQDGPVATPADSVILTPEAVPTGLTEGEMAAAIAVPVIVAAALGAFLLVFFLVIRPRQKKKGAESTELGTAYVAVPVPGVATGSNKSLRWELSPNDVLLQKKLGEGSFGVVWRGKLNKVTDVAVKITKNDTSKTSAEMIKEAQVMAELRPHPNIVQLFGVYSDEEKFHLVMEYCARGSLEHFLKAATKLDGTAIRNLLRGIASGMSHLHSQNVIHRDLAARNILLSDQGVPKISDFGMARIVGVDNTGKTLNTIGPVKWMSPESLMTREYSNKSDVWSFGVLTWEMVFCHEPYDGIDLLELALHIREKKAHPDVTQCEDEFLRTLMLKCWAPDPKDRPSFDEIVLMLNNEVGIDENDVSSYTKPNVLLGVETGASTGNYVVVPKVDNASGSNEKSEKMLIESESIVE